MKNLGLLIFALFISCGQSSKDKSIEEISKSLGVNKDELDSKSFYSFIIENGDLSGKTYLNASYAQTMNGFRYGGNSKIESFEVTFIDPEQGDSAFKVSFKNETVLPFDTVEGSEFKLSILNNGKIHVLTSKSGTININKFIDKKASPDDPRGSFANERRIELDFKGVFVDQTTNEDLNVNGKLQFVKN